MKRAIQPAGLEKRTENIWRASTEIEVMTPIFGGGVESGASNAPHLKDVDPITPIRSAVIRAQMRYWWRACCGATYPSVQDMWKREAYIFGSASGLRADQSRGILTLSIKQTRDPTISNLIVYTSNGQAAGNRPGLAYAAFPLRPAENSDTRKYGNLSKLAAGQWLLQVLYTAESSETWDWDVDVQELRIALSAVLLFGNIGGRGSRGFGQLGVKASNSTDLFSTLKDFIEELGRYQNGKELLAELPSVSPDSFHLTKRPKSDSLDMLEYTLKKFWEFRQVTTIARDGRSKSDTVPGASRWPEAQYIRNLTGDGSKTRQYKLKDAGHGIATPARKVPRAVFGLPIQMQFKEIDRKNGQEPKGTIHFTPKDAERFPSLLRIAILADEGAYRAVCIKMQNTLPKIHVEIPEENKSDTASHELTAEELEKIRNRGLKSLRTVDVIDSFIAHLGAEKISPGGN